jgi:uncharacterized YccA/Bax inhibitor family protein
VGRESKLPARGTYNRRLEVRTMFRTGNPALKETTFRGMARAMGEEAMTLQGTVNKTGLSLLILLTAAAFVWNSDTPAPFMLVGLMGGLIAALVTVFKRTAAPYTVPVYAAFEGLLLGGLSLHFETRYPGIVINAVGLTFGTLAVLLAAYSSGVIKPSENFKLGVFAATGAVGLLYLVGLGMSFFGKSIPFIHDSGPIGIAFSLFVVGLAALNLVLDFDFIEKGAAAGAPKYMEWVGAFGLLVTLVWLYIEILRLLAKLQDRRR